MYEHNLSHGTPDAVFPNNWFSTHAEGEGNGKVGEATMVLYPMKVSQMEAVQQRLALASFKTKHTLKALF